MAVAAEIRPAQEQDSGSSERHASPPPKFLVPTGTIRSDLPYFSPGVVELPVAKAENTLVADVSRENFGRENLQTGEIFPNAVQQSIANMRRELGSQATQGQVLEAFHHTSDRLFRFIDRLAPSEQNGNLSEEKRRELSRKLGRYRVRAIEMLTVFDGDIDDMSLGKLSYMWEGNYHPQRVTDTRTRYAKALDAMADLKNKRKRGEIPPIQNLVVSPEDEAARTPHRKFKDTIQDMINVWQVQAFGSQLNAKDRLPNLRGEDSEVREEIETLSKGGTTEALKGELIDAIIAVDGYMAVVGIEAEDVSYDAINEIKLEYAKTLKTMRRQGKSFHEAWKEVMSTIRGVAKNGRDPFLTPIPIFTFKQPKPKSELLPQSS